MTVVNSEKDCRLRQEVLLRAQERKHARDLMNLFMETKREGKKLGSRVGRSERTLLGTF